MTCLIERKVELWRPITEVIFDHARQRADQTAMIFDLGEGAVVSYTYAELACSVRRVAGALVDSGLARQRVALLFAPGADFVVAMLGCLAAGSVAVPIAPMGRRSERVKNLLPLMEDCSPAALLLDASMASQYGTELSDAMGASKVKCLEIGSLLNSSACNELPMLSMADLAVLQFTSGSTNRPKGVMITHENIIANEEMIQRAFAHDDRSGFVGWAPHFHDQGLFGNILQPLYLGSTCVLTAPAAFVQRPIMWLELIDRYRAHTSGGPNFAFDLCVEHVARRGMPPLDLSSWKVAFNGAERVRAGSLMRFAECFASVGFQSEAFLPCYGLAESTLVTIASNPRTAPHFKQVDTDMLTKGRAIASPEKSLSLQLVCCGPAMEGATAIIVDPAKREILPDGEIGEIWLQGRHIAIGYWDRPQETHETFGAVLDDGSGPFLRTGDLAFKEAEGFYIMGRIKDLIIVRGRNYSPGDIEQIWTDISGRVRQASSAAVQLEIGNRSHIVLIGEMDRSEIRNLTDQQAQDLARKLRALAIERLELSITDIVLVPHGAISRTTSGKVRRSDTAHRLLTGQLAVHHMTGPLTLEGLEGIKNVR